MLDGLFVVSVIGTVVESIKEKFVKEVPLENWANKDLWNEDILNGVPIEECMKRLENGRYKKFNEQTKVYPKPHRDSNGEIVIENSQLYYNDIINYKPLQVQEWIEQGKYNLTPEELEKEKKRIEEKYRRLYSY